MPGETDWFGFPVRPDGGRPFEPVPCPVCTEPFEASGELRAHVREVHGIEPELGQRVLPQADRVTTWFRGLRFLPLWFVIPANLVLWLILYRLWGSDLQMYVTGDDYAAVIKTWLLRFAMLPTVLVLAWRVVDKRV